MLLGVALPSASHASPDVVARATARAEGNDRTRAVALGETLFATVWPAQVLKVRVDSVGEHHVAGILLSGVRFHGRLHQDGFLREVRDLIVTALRNPSIEEVDVWAVIPIRVPKGADVSGPTGEPTTQTVFSATVQRTQYDRLDTLLRSPDVFWDPTWRSRLPAT